MVSNINYTFIKKKDLKTMPDHVENKKKKITKNFAVYLEICDVADRKKAKELAKKVKCRFDDLELQVNICISEYEQVQLKIKKKKDLK